MTVPANYGTEYSYCTSAGSQGGGVVYVLHLSSRAITLLFMIITLNNNKIYIFVLLNIPLPRNALDIAYLI